MGLRSEFGERGFENEIASMIGGVEAICESMEDTRRFVSERLEKCTEESINPTIDFIMYIEMKLGFYTTHLRKALSRVVDNYDD